MPPIHSYIIDSAILPLILCLIAGILIGWGIAHARSTRRFSMILVEKESRISVLGETLHAKNEHIQLLANQLTQLESTLARSAKKRAAYARALAAVRSRLGTYSAFKKEIENKTVEMNRLRDLLTEAKQKHSVMETLMISERKAASEKIALLSDLQTQLADGHKALSAQALRDNNATFMDLARTTMDKYMDSARNDLESKNQAVKELLQPIQDTLSQYSSQVKAMEMARENAYGSLTQQMLTVANTQEILRKETVKLSRALRSPNVRGRWGEITLKRVVELAGMQNQCDFYEQPSMGPDGGKHRPDMIINLPGNRLVIVDSKVPMTAYLEAMETDSDREKNEKLQGHAKQFRSHILQLAQKSYWEKISPTPEFVVMFIPGENFLAAALSVNPRLIESGAKRNIILATPTTLIALLKSIAFGWRQELLMENAHQISRMGAQFYERLFSLTSHVNRLGQDLSRCITTFNRLTGTLNHRVVPAAKRFEEMGIQSKGPMHVEPLDKEPKIIGTEK